MLMMLMDNPLPAAGTVTIRAGGLLTRKYKACPAKAQIFHAFHYVQSITEIGTTITERKGHYYQIN